MMVQVVKGPPGREALVTACALVVGSAPGSTSGKESGSPAAVVAMAARRGEVQVVSG
jgi:hypothetical protein